MREYKFKPAAARKAQTWAIKDNHLMRRGGDSALDLAAVVSASWNTVSYRGTRSAWLHLQADGEVFKIECTDHGGARGGFLDLVRDVAATLSQVNPALEIKHGYSAPWRIALFVFGLAATALAVFLIYAGLTNMTGRGAVQATLAGLAILILMVPVAWTCRPNHKARTYPPQGLVEEIDLWLGAPVPDPDHNPGGA